MMCNELLEMGIDELKSEISHVESKINDLEVDLVNIRRAIAELENKKNPIWEEKDALESMKTALGKLLEIKEQEAQ